MQGSLTPLVCQINETWSGGSGTATCNLITCPAYTWTISMHNGEVITPTTVNFPVTTANHHFTFSLSFVVPNIGTFTMYQKCCANGKWYSSKIGIDYPQTNSPLSSSDFLNNSTSSNYIGVSSIGPCGS